MRLVECIAAGHQTRQHARIGRVHLAGDQRQPNARQLFHVEAPEHLDIGMARAHQHDILDHGSAVLLHGHFPYWRWPLLWRGV
jgi:hypothetical protein